MLDFDPADFAPILFEPIMRQGQLGRTELPSRINERIVENEHGCWIWQGRTRNGNLSPNEGQIWWGKKNHPAHRFVFEWLVGDLRDGYTISHLCDVPSCVNPEHMEPISRGEAIHRGHDAAREDRERRSTIIVQEMMERKVAERVESQRGE